MFVTQGISFMATVKFCQIVPCSGTVRIGIRENIDCVDFVVSRGALNTASMGAFKTSQLIFLFHTVFCHNPQV